MGKTENKDLIRIAAEIGAKAAMDRLDKERAREKEERTDHRLHNTRLLLKNYRLFKKHAENAVYEVGQLDESVYDILDLMERNTGNVFVDSIKTSVARTSTLVQHIDAMLGIYKTYCISSRKPEDVRRWRVIQAKYVDECEKSNAEIADQECVSDRTIDRDTALAHDQLAALFFGIDGISKQ